MAIIETKITPTTDTLSKRHRAMLTSLIGNEKAFKKIAILLDRWVQLNFKTEGGKVGKWKKFKVREDGRRGRWIKRKGLDTTAKLLQDTGRLRASFKPFASRDNAGIGSDIKYSIYHENGIGHLPKRRMLPNKREIFKESKKIIDNHIQDSLKKLAGK